MLRKAFPAEKKNRKARPVAVGDTFRRIIEKVVLDLPPNHELLHSLLLHQTRLTGIAMCEQVVLSL